MVRSWYLSERDLSQDVLCWSVSGRRKISLFTASLNITLTQLPALLLAWGEGMPGHMGVIKTPFFFFFYTLLVAHSRPTDKDGVSGTLLYG